jgi:adenylate cyclase
VPIERERKFLIKNEEWRSAVKDGGELIRQGYLVAEKERSVRVRVAGDMGYLAVKGETVGIACLEYEYPIPVDEADEILTTLCDRPLIEKIRYRIPYEDSLWEIDEFRGENQGLIVAEVEMDDAREDIPLPHWIGEEVSHDPRYLNVNLVKKPFFTW